MRLPRLLLGLILGAALAPVACGDDSAGGNPADGAGDAGEAGAAGRAEPGGGGSESAGAANAGGGGGGDSSLAGNATATQGGGGGDGDQAGAGNLADCTARKELPDPFVGFLRVPASCKAPPACGGTLTEGKWAYADVCVDATSVFAPIYTECATSKLTGPSDIVVDGTLELAGDMATHHAVVSATGVFQIPAECAACDCKGIQDVFKQHGAGPNTYCYPECYPDNSCRCLVDFEITIDESGTYSAADHTVTVAGGKTYDFCASASGLTLTEPGAAPGLPGSASLVPFAATVSPEICDGIDNDKDGALDNEPQDCPAVPCNGKGVCAGARPACVGGYWSCDYSGIDDYEMSNETTCDGLDNDCDGEVDEGLVGCYERCDGLDNDNNGNVDDDPQDNPCGLAKLGVCATGVRATCLGKAGWQCDFDAQSYEAEESTCGDGLDNDCDGQVDEGCSCPLGKSQMFVVEWGTSPALLRADLDGTNAAPIPALSGFPIGQVAVDAKNDKLYWSDGSNHINRSNLDGSANEVVWTGKAQTWAVNPANGVLIGECDTRNICRLNPPNTTSTLLMPAAATWVNLDPVNQVVWWADYANYDYAFAHVNVDGSAFAGIGKRQPSAPSNFEIDVAGQQLYWQKGQAIFAVGTDGSNERQVAPLNNAYAYDMAVDHNGGKLYYTEVNASQVRRVGLDGKNDELLIPDVTYAVSIALYICP
jgi:hypothetical protein